jgi:preprotein translocase subunit YajC
LENVSGFDPAGLDYLINMSNEYYERRRQERSLKKGDRVALIAGGIAVVDQVCNKEVQVVLRNRQVLKIARKGIVWDECNMRWECEALLEEQCV